MAGIDSTLLHQYFTYKDGELYWNQVDGYSNQVKIGDLAGHIHKPKNKEPHRRITLFKKRYFAHQLVFMMFHGYIPKQIDHDDGNGLNNKINNLREATSQQNSFNKGLRADNKCGYKNVCWRADTKKWRVQLRINGKLITFGSFDDLELADLVATEARDLYHKKWAKHK
jgi:hypothetical protein